MADQYFSERELNERIGLQSVDHLWEWISSGAAGIIGRSQTPLPSYDEAPDEVFYRGQPNAAYGISSSLYRLCHQTMGERVTEELMHRAEQAILKEMKTQGLGRLMKDGELLAVLQHHGIPTRLIDVSERPREALFFAVDRDDDIPGRLFIIRLKPGSEGQHRIDLRANDALEWEGTKRGTKQARGEWTTRVAVDESNPLDPRMRAQRGRFLVGGLIASYPGMEMNRPGGKRVSADDRASITTLSISFPLQSTELSKNWPATGWSIRIPASWKRPLRELLAETDPPITTDSMYPPISEVRRLAVRKAEDAIREGP
ncbi:FRG domain-containing protein [Streptomyces antibioticus]|uniref:FRG domain-containing protein n=1 Tax=Streptomyces TaxID=1883 RepID=UPI00167194C0|nr:FRG domain-containing protein [Streptomyces tanashiensis]